ncbi:Hypothetical_protein [Hexamita inflata]|uniref:Hypothetical_protein n=1 Tax=Hexamita inflata TaxID=28002 RepID=A0ABP1KH30_9EUKA
MKNQEITKSKNQEIPKLIWCKMPEERIINPLKEQYDNDEEVKKHECTYVQMMADMAEQNSQEYVQNQINPKGDKEGYHFVFLFYLKQLREQSVYYPLQYFLSLKSQTFTNLFSQFVSTEADMKLPLQAYLKKFYYDFEVNGEQFNTYFSNLKITTTQFLKIARELDTTETKENYIKACLCLLPNKKFDKAEFSMFIRSEIIDYKYLLLDMQKQHRFMIFLNQPTLAICS